MAHVNIGADNADDAFYRYKMPRLVAKIEGRGNGIKTNIVNMVDVAKALSRPPAYTTKYFGCVLGAQSKFDDKSGTSTVNGAHDTSKLVQHLEGFIKTYVQCYGCGNPETEINITKNQCITLKCAACGFVSDVDMRDKLTTFILKNPPEVKKKKGDKSMRRAEKERIKAGEALDEEGSKKSKKEAGSSTKKKASSSKSKGKKMASAGDEADDESPESSQRDEADDDQDEDDDVEWQTDTSAEAAKKRIQEQLTAATAEMVMVSTADDAKPANGVANGKGPKPEEAKEEVVAVQEEEAEEEEEGEDSEHEALVAELVDYIQTHKLAEVADFVAKKEPDADLFIALVEALLGNVSKGFSKEVVKKKAVLSAIAKDEEAQKNLLLGVEHFFAVKAGAAAKEVALVLKALYDEEMVEEEVIFDWESSKALCPGLSAEQAATIRKLSAPFLDWLKEAEEDEEDEE